MSETCPDCDLSLVMLDGSLFCALYEQQTHGDSTCQYWINDPTIFVDIKEKGYGLDET